MKMLIFYATVWALTNYVALALEFSRNGFFDHCSTEGSREMKVYFGWPFKLSCDEVSMTDIYELQENTDVVRCLIFDNSKQIVALNETYSDQYSYVDYDIHPQYEAGVLNVNSSTNFTVALQTDDNQCWSVDINLLTSNSPNETCEESMQNSQHITVKMAHGKDSHFTCAVPLSVSPKIHGQNFTSRWLRNCESFIPERNNMRIVDNRLQALSAAYSDAGIYTCAITHNQLTRYVVHFSACVQPPVAHGLFALACKHQVIHVDEGADAIIECEANEGSGGLSIYALNSYWLKTEKDGTTERVCHDFGVGMRSRSSTFIAEKFDCEMKTNRTACFDRVPTGEEESRAFKSKIKLKLIIRNVSPSDYGTYTAVVENFLVKVNATVIIKKDHASTAAKATVGIAGAFGGVLGLLIILGIVYLLRTRRGDRQLTTAKYRHCRIFKI